MSILALMCPIAEAAFTGRRTCKEAQVHADSRCRDARHYRPRGREHGSLPGTPYVEQEAQARPLHAAHHRDDHARLALSVKVAYLHHYRIAEPRRSSTYTDVAQVRIARQRKQKRRPRSPRAQRRLCGRPPTDGESRCGRWDGSAPCRLRHPCIRQRATHRRCSERSARFAIRPSGAGRLSRRPGWAVRPSRPCAGPSCSRSVGRAPTARRARGRMGRERRSGR
jgi:hypothetical protein